VIPKKYRIHVVLVIASLFMIAYPLLNQRPEPAQAKLAEAAAAAFLEQIDAGESAAGWRMAARKMQQTVSEQEWVEALEAARERLGPVVARTEDDVSYSQMAEDSDEGDYIQVIYKTRFERAGEMKEYVTVMLEDGEWKVAGYSSK
jgi:hypothetical protein